MFRSSDLGEIRVSFRVRVKNRVRVRVRVKVRVFNSGRFGVNTPKNFSPYAQILKRGRHNVQINLFLITFISPPENDSFRNDFCFAVVSFFSRRVISELRRPIDAKFCTMLLSMFDFIIPGRNFGGASPKYF